MQRKVSSWTSTPDLDEAQKGNGDVSISISLPKRRHTANFDIPIKDAVDADVSTALTIKRPPIPAREKSKEVKNTEATEVKDEVVILKSDSLAERVRKMQLLKKQGSVERDTSRDRSVPRKSEKYEMIYLKKNGYNTYYNFIKLEKKFHHLR